MGGRYKVVRELGRGGMGIVLEVENVLIGKNFALKLLDMHVATPDAVRRFQREAKLLSELDHPNIIRALDFGILEEGTPYVLMELLQGQTLAEQLRLHGQLPVSKFNEIFLPILNALDYAHRSGIVHRDLKPGNIMIKNSPDGEIIPKLLDFGIAAWTEKATEAFTKTGEIIGTPLYISPEQVSGQPVTARSDLYSLGCVMFEALTGAPPFAGRTALETLMMHKEKPMPRLNEASLGGAYPAYLEEVLQKLLSKDSQERFASANEVAQALVSATSIASKKSEQKDAPVKFGEKQTLFIGTGLALICALAIGFYFVSNSVGNKNVTASQNNISSISQQKTDKKSSSDKQKSPGADLSTAEALRETQEDLALIKTSKRGSQLELHFDPADRPIGLLNWFDKGERSSGTGADVSIPMGIKFWLQPNLSNANSGEQVARFENTGLYGLIFHMSRNSFVMADETMTKCLKLMPDSIKGVQFDETLITESDIKALQHLNELVWLGVKDSDIDENLLPNLAAIAITKNLRTLVLNPRQSAWLPKPFLEKLASTKSNLKELSVTHCFIDASDCQNIAKIISLKYLNAMNCFSKVNRPVALKIISKLPNLEILAIDGEDVDDESARDLLAMKSLRKIIIPSDLPPKVKQRIENSHRIKIERTDGPDTGFQPWRSPSVD